MSERIILSDECRCNATSNDLIFNNGSSFKLVYHFTSYFGSDIDLNKFDLVAQFWIQGREDEVIEYSKPSISNDRVIVEPFRSTVKFIFREYNLRTGRLMYRFKFTLQDPTIPGSWINDYAEGYTGIIIK